MPHSISGVPSLEARAKRRPTSTPRWPGETPAPRSRSRSCGGKTASSSARRASGTSSDGRGRTGHPSHGRGSSRRLRDWLHVAHALGHPYRSQHRGQAAHADARLRSVAACCASAFTPTRATSAPAPRSNASADSLKGFSALTAWRPTSSRATQCATRSLLPSGPTVKERLLQVVDR